MLPSGRVSAEASPMGRVYVPHDTPRGVALFYTTQEFEGTLDDRSVDLIRQFLMKQFDIDAALWSCHQVHGTDAVRVSPSPRWGEGSGVRGSHADCGRCDALWSHEQGVALAIKVADCLPVTLVDPQNSVIANIHSGWRGAAGRITAQTLDRLRSESSFSPDSAHAFLGPSIRGCCFEVGNEVVEEFRGASPEIEKYVNRSRGERPYLDLAGMTTDLLSGYGIQRGSIHDTGLCTRCAGSDFHSYRRDRARMGRNLAIVAQ